MNDEKTRQVPWLVWPLVASAVNDSRTVAALMVMPRSRSRSMLSRNWALRSRSLSAPVASSSRSASVDLP